MKKKLYRSRKDAVFAGVCGGLAEYLGIDSTIVRLIWAILIMTVRAGIWLYIIAALIIPKDDGIIEGTYYEES